MGKSKAAIGLGDFLETWGRKLKNEPKPELPRRTIEEEAKIFEERNKELAEAIRIRESLARGEPLKEADYYRSVDKVGEKLNIPQPEAEAFLKEYYNGDPRLYLSEYYSKKYPRGSSVVNDSVKTSNTEPLSAPLKNKPIRDETLTDVHLKNEPPKPEAPNNVTEAVTPEAKAINTATSVPNPEVPKDPSNVGALLMNALKSFNTDGAIYGGALGFQYPDESAYTHTRIGSALLGALAGGYGVGFAGKGLKALRKPNLPSAGSILKKENVVSLARKLPAVPIVFWDETKSYFSPKTSKPEDTSPSIGTPLGTPANTPVNTNRQAPRNTSDRW